MSTPAQAKKKANDCFIIAPINTPKEIAERYAGDQNHFANVLNHLLIPAITKAGLNPVPPTMKGTDVIHAQIIRNLEEMPYVVCDISSLNPNVMLELGIRTALNKPVIIVRDAVTPTEKVPFDVGLINNHTYASGPSWTLVDEITRLTDHIEKSVSETENALWKYFGLRLTAQHTPRGGGGVEDKLELLLAETTALRREMAAIQSTEKPLTFQSAKVNPHFFVDPSAFMVASEIGALPVNPWIGLGTSPEMELKTAAQAMGAKVSTTYTLGDTVSLWLTQGTTLTDKQRAKLEEIAKLRGFKVSVLSIG